MRSIRFACLLAAGLALPAAANAVDWKLLRADGKTVVRQSSVGIGSP
jgi:hypothetical protein